MSNTDFETDDGAVAAAHQALGEFVVIFQRVEDLYRQIGWFILDPARKHWPPTELRRETPHILIDKVTELFVGLTRTYAFANAEEKANDILELRERFQDLRLYRNRLLHSTFVELKASGEVYGYVRANTSLGVDPETGKLVVDLEEFSADAIHAKIREYADCMQRLSALHLQLIHWAPFDSHGIRQDVSRSSHST
ncbi:hypothetical protein KPB04_25450 [Burkholderia cenocepacia]|uniref:hypothetical protein n=1 Tax=Burkholderia cenocepacia TaxID=95486 RepID=UPI0028624DFE|nr:hypothetical protein [Burkholderia cenocepacia]MDR8105077.1 hypothetical protein [Burkholderia cenocepacia]